jgi:hypothetical protein
LKTSRHGVIADSINTPRETFDSPSRRSTKVIGTSAIRQPSRAAPNSVSIWNE